MEELSKVAQYCEQDTSFKEPPKSASSINKSHYKPSEFGLRCTPSTSCRALRRRSFERHFAAERATCARTRWSLRTTSSACASNVLRADPDWEPPARDEFSSGDPELYGGGRHSANMYSYIVLIVQYTLTYVVYYCQSVYSYLYYCIILTYRYCQCVRLDALIILI